MWDRALALGNDPGPVKPDRAMTSPGQSAGRAQANLLLFDLRIGLSRDRANAGEHAGEGKRIHQSAGLDLRFEQVGCRRNPITDE